MNEFMVKDICNHIRNGTEFKYIKKVSDYYKIDFYHLCDFTLDLYNYEVRTGLDRRGAKIMALNNLADYAISIGVYKR